MFRWLDGQFGKTSRKGVLALIDQAAFSGSNFLTTVVIGRFCGLDQLGFYSLAFAVLVFLAVIHEALVWTPYTIYSHRLKHDERPEYAGTILFVQGLFTLAGIAVLLALAGVLSAGLGPAGLAPVMWVLAAAAPCYLLRELVRRLLLARLEVTTVLVIDVMVAVMQFGGFFALYWHGGLSAATACAVVGIACLLTSVAWFATTAFRFVFHLRNVAGQLRRHWSFGRWICASQMADSAHNYALHWLVAVALGTGATGVFAACSSLVLVFNPLVLGIGSVLVPRASQAYVDGGNAEVRRVVWKTTVFLVATMSVICVGLALFGDRALQLLYDGKEYAGHGLVITLLAVATLAGTFAFAMNHGLRVVERPDINFIARAGGLAITLTVSFLLIGMWGIAGVAIARLFGMSVASAAQCAVFARITRAPVVPGGAA
jgi:O-antigen/teichoic acid export membrane protein